MMNKISRYLAQTLLVLLCAYPLAPVYAQEASSTLATAVDPTSLLEVTPSPQDTIPADSLVVTQDPTDLSATASSTQVTIAGDTLVQTEDPSLLSDASSTTTPLFQDEASANPTDAIAIPDTATVGNTIPVTGEATSTETVPLVSDATEPDTASTTLPDVVAVMPIAALPPKPSFVFSIGSSHIAADRRPHWQRKGSDQASSTAKVITDTTSVAVDPTLGVPVISGSCSNTYYVILLYKNQTDYSLDPASYILNNAYPCVGGTYSYTIKNLPQSLTSGTYYLLVGAMGNSGPWTPASSLVPITITNQ